MKKEGAVVARTPGSPATVSSLSIDLAALGVVPGMVLLLHSSLSSLGWVCGGAVAVILALQDALGVQGTLLMPTHSGDLSDPARWENPPVPEAWWDTIRATMPAYDRDLTPTRGVGVIPEVFRKQRGVVRSDHPQVSFAAWGARAEEVTAAHSLDFGLGENSPLARVYDLGGWVLLLGVGHQNNTSLHLAQYRAVHSYQQIVANGAPVLVNGRRAWIRLQDVQLDDADFQTIGQCFARETKHVRRGRVAGAQALLMPQRSLVDYALHWMEEKR